MNPDLLGWAASAVLLMTLCRQIYIQAKTRAEGVSKFLFLGQITASIGFIAYSWLLKNWVFIFTNSAILLTAVIGQLVVVRQKSKRKE